MSVSGIIIGSHKRSNFIPHPVDRTISRRIPNEFYPTPPEASAHCFRSNGLMAR